MVERISGNPTSIQKETIVVPGPVGTFTIRHVHTPTVNNEAVMYQGESSELPALRLLERAIPQIENTIP